MVKVVARARTTEMHRAIGQLVVGALFFAMRSCEYSEASGSRRTKTVRMKTVRIGGIVFRLGGEPIRSVDEEVLASADTVSVTYRTQKNGERGATVTQHRSSTSQGAGLCPVHALAGLVSRISVYELGTSQWGEVRRDL